MRYVACGGDAARGPPLMFCAPSLSFLPPLIAPLPAVQCIYHDYYENPCALGGNYTSHFTNKLLTFAAARTERRRHLSPQHRLRHDLPELRVPQEPPRAEAARDPQSLFVAEGEG